MFQSTEDFVIDCSAPDRARLSGVLRLASPADYEERFEPRYGYLRPVVARAVPAFLECGRLQNGFARIRCPRCRGEHLLAFSCQTRNFCPSCQAPSSAPPAKRRAKRQASTASTG